MEILHSFKNNKSRYCPVLSYMASHANIWYLNDEKTKNLTTDPSREPLSSLPLSQQQKQHLHIFILQLCFCRTISDGDTHSVTTKVIQPGQ